MEKEKELRIFAVAIGTCDKSGCDITDTTDEAVFMDEAEEQGHVWSIRGFCDELNHDHFNSDHYWVKAIKV